MMPAGIMTSWKTQWARNQAETRAKAHSDRIDSQILEDSKIFRRICIVLLLGHNGDISTIVKQMKMRHEDGYTPEERIKFRPTIWKSLLETGRSVVQVLRGLHAEPATLQSKANWECIMSHPTSTDSAEFSLKPELADAVRDLWTDDMTPVLLDSPSHFSSSLLDDAAYFFSEARRITSTDYIPSNEDILRTPARVGAGITETHFKMGQLSLRLCHISGLRSERKKWIHQFESVTSIIFCAPLTGYDQVGEDGGNLLGEYLFLFESVVNSRWFLRTSIILFLTGIDQFRARLPKVPLDKYYPEYTGGADVNKAARYILWRFMQANRARLSVYPHITHATDTSNIQLVFTTVKETILHNALRASNILK